MANTNSANGTSRTAAMENYAKAEEAIRQYRDANKNTAASKTISTFSKETLRSYLQNVTSNEKNLRNLSWYLYYRSQVYNRICNFFANMFTLDSRSIIPNYDLVKGGDSNKVLKSYNDTLDILDNMRVQDELYNAFLTCFIQDVFYGVVFYDDGGLFIYNFPADYCKITGKYMTGDYSYSIDTSYFKQHKELLEYYPEPFEQMYNEAQSSGIKWQPVPDENCLCLKFRSEDYETVLPPFVPIFNSLISLADLENIQAIADEQQIYKLIWMELETINGSKDIDDWKIDPSIAVQYMNRMINEALPSYVSAALIPGKLETISFSDDDQTTDTSKIAKATESVLNTAGGAETLNGATINNTYAFQMAGIQNTEYAISSLLPQAQSWVNRFLSYQISNPAKVKFFPVSVYTKKDFKDQLLQAAQNGLSTKLAYNTLNGFSEKDTLALNFLEEDVLHLADKLVPLSTSYTKSDKGNDKAYSPEPSGAPTKDAKDLTDSGDRSRNK